MDPTNQRHPIVQVICVGWVCAIHFLKINLHFGSTFWRKCLCIYTHIYIYMCVYIYTYIIYIIYIYYVYVYLYMYAFKYIYMHLHIYHTIWGLVVLSGENASVYTSVYIHIYIYIYVYIYTYIIYIMYILYIYHKHIYVYICTFKYMYLPTYLSYNSKFGSHLTSTLGIRVSWDPFNPDWMGPSSLWFLMCLSSEWRRCLCIYTYIFICVYIYTNIIYII